MRSIIEAFLAKYARPKETRYHCAECRRVVAVKDGKILRMCDHNDAVVVAEVAAVCTGTGRLVKR